MKQFLFVALLAGFSTAAIAQNSKSAAPGCRKLAAVPVSQQTKPLTPLMKEHGVAYTPGVLSAEKIQGQRYTAIPQATYRTTHRRERMPLEQANAISAPHQKADAHGAAIRK